MGVIEDFVSRYRREFDFYDQAARLVAQLLDARLQAAGIRAMVTFRAKAVGRLEPKVRDRAQRKAYATVEDIYADIPDLAGVRVALYFPAQRDQVGVIIDELFVTLHKKPFPDGSAPKYSKRFSGYSATHYRVRLRETTLPDSQKRYAEARVEVQVASVLMHAWAEVEHDLVYKPYQGVLSEDEYAILDELNGMVIAGEIALERLQRAGDVRVAARGRTFANHYELAAHLLSALREFADPAALQAGLGRVDLLQQLLATLGLANPEGVGRYLNALHPDLERRPIADQIVDQLLSEDPARYKLYEEIRSSRPSPDAAPEVAEPVTPDAHEAMGQFLTAWIEFERLVRDLTPSSLQERGPVIPTARVLASLIDLDTDTRGRYERLRRMRNHLVHGIEIPNADDLREAARELEAIREQLLDAAPKAAATDGG
jgi:ppGpp synthetase/RelA/SpoT-type nucleotidyltranferase